jgi:hypothetical protein
LQSAQIEVRSKFFGAALWLDPSRPENRQRRRAPIIDLAGIANREFMQGRLGRSRFTVPHGVIAYE